MPTTLRVPGEETESRIETDAPFHSKRIEISALRAGQSLEPLAVNNDDIVMLEFEDGFHRWIRVEDLAKEGFVTRSSGPDPDTIEIQLTYDDIHVRGESLALKALELIGFKPDEKIQKWIADKFKQEANGKLKDVLGKECCP